MLIIRSTDKIEESWLLRARTTASGSLSKILSRIWAALSGRVRPTHPRIAARGRSGENWTTVTLEVAQMGLHAGNDPRPGAVRIECARRAPERSSLYFRRRAVAVPLLPSLTANRATSCGAT